MRKIRTFATVFIQSMVSPAYYRDLLQAKMSFSIKYAIMLALCLTVVGMVKVVLPIALFPVQTSLQTLVQQFPSKLVVKVNQGRVSINQAYPFVIPMPTVWKTAQTPANLVIFDSDEHLASTSAEELKQSLFAIGQTALYAPPDPTTNQENIMPLPEKLQLPTISMGQLNIWRQQFVQEPWVKYRLYIPLLMVTFLVVMWPIVFLFRWLTALFYAVDAYVVAKIFNKRILHGQKVSFGKIFQISFHTITLPTVLALFSTLLLPDFLFQGFVYFVIYLVFTLFVLHRVTAQALS